MILRNITFTEIERLQGQTAKNAGTLEMDQEAFHGFYESTARPVWVFLYRRTGDDQLADDLLQDTYYRFLRTRKEFENETHRRNYLFRIARNLANDALRWRRDRSCAPLPDDAASEPVAGGGMSRPAERTGRTCIER
jgi:RNA polymerase sigma factor (sigma-70 family)